MSTSGTTVYSCGTRTAGYDLIGYSWWSSGFFFIYIHVPPTTYSRWCLHCLLFSHVFETGLNSLPALASPVRLSLLCKWVCSRQIYSAVSPLSLSTCREFGRDLLETRELWPCTLALPSPLIQSVQISRCKYIPAEWCYSTKRHAWPLGLRWIWEYLFTDMHLCKCFFFLTVTLLSNVVHDVCPWI